jgi:RNA polymerase sigma-70 factor, ECF subfamily
MNNGFCYTAVVKRHPQFFLFFTKVRMVLLPKNNRGFEQISDEILITWVARGEPAALEVLYDRYAGLILGICLKIIGDRAEAEGALQEIFWQIWQRATTYEAQRGSFEGWLFRIARNLAIDVSRQRSSKLTKK